MLGANYQTNKEKNFVRHKIRKQLRKGIKRHPIKYALTMMRIVMIIVAHRRREVNAASRHSGVVRHRASHAAGRSEKLVVVSQSVASGKNLVVVSQSGVASPRAILSAKCQIQLPTMGI